MNNWYIYLNIVIQSVKIFLWTKTPCRLQKLNKMLLKLNEVFKRKKKVTRAKFKSLTHSELWSIVHVLRVIDYSSIPSHLTSCECLLSWLTPGRYYSIKCMWPLNFPLPCRRSGVQLHSHMFSFRCSRIKTLCPCSRGSITRAPPLR